MKRAATGCVVAAVSAGVLSIAGAQRAPAPLPEPPERMLQALPWTTTPALPGVQLAWLAGGADRPGLYELRVRLAPGARVPPHTHPDMRCATVLSGTLTAWRSPTVEPEQAKRYPAGSFHCVPAGVVHYVVARDGEVVFQDSGVGAHRHRVGESAVSGLWRTGVALCQGGRRMPGGTGRRSPRSRRSATGAALAADQPQTRARTAPGSTRPSGRCR